MKDLLKKCDQVSEAEVSELALRLLNQWNPPGQEASVAQILEHELRAAGADEVYLDEEFAGSPSVICWLRGKTPGPTMQWHGHMDTITTPHPPPILEGGLLKGRGAADMKGALAAMVIAVRLLRDSGFPRSGQLLLTFHGLHEEGGSSPLLRLFERGIVGDAVLIGEVASGKQLVTSSGGLSFWDIELDSGVNPVHETNRLPNTPDVLLAALHVHSALTEYSKTVEAQGGSIFIGKFAIGDYYNRVPMSGSIAGTRRHTNNETLDSVKAEFEEFAEQLKKQLSLTVRCRVDGIADAYRIDPETRVALALRSAIFKLTGETMEVKSTKTVGNAAHFVQIAGIPAVYHGANYKSAHSDEEEASVGELTQLVRAYALTTAFFLEPELMPNCPPLI